MSINLSKNKEKRSRSSSNEANKSFVKNVTSRVSGLLPSAVTKWFSSPSSSNANGSAPTADATDSSTEDEAPESPVTTQPPTKRMRFTSPGGFNQFSPTETNCTSNDYHEVESSNTFGAVQSPPGLTTFRRETNLISTTIRSSTDTSSDRTDTDMSMFKSQHSVSTTGSTIATKRKSLFDSPGNAETSVKACAKTACNSLRDPSQPCFKPSLLGSPFYPGRTMYGGASSSYLNRPNIKQRRNTQVNESNTSDNTVSHSTRRIMDLLEHYSSPLNEAKRIHQYIRTPKDTSLSSSFSSSSPPSNKVISYKTQELHVPSIASILRLKQKSRLMDTTTAARQIIASHSSTSDFVPYPKVNTQKTTTEKEISINLTTKVKSRLTKLKRGERHQYDVETELPAPVSLPSATLAIDESKLPKFSFEVSLPSSLTTTATSKPPVFTNVSLAKESKSSKNFETPTSKPDIVTDATSFKFSSPVTISSELPQTQATFATFTFPTPEKRVDNFIDHKDKDDDSLVASENNQNKKEKDWQCADCWVFNKPDIENCVCCGSKKPAQEKKSQTQENHKQIKCAVCKLANAQPLSDDCVNCESNKVTNSSKPLKKQENSSKWKCDECWVENDKSSQQCACCGAKNPKQTAEIKKDVIMNDKENEWKCEDCWIKNKSSLDKCAACGGAKPGSSPATAHAPAALGFFNAPISNAIGTSVATDSTFKNIIKTQSATWECPSCLVQNGNDKTKCVCCETEREGATKEKDKKSFNFGMNTNTTFKFGIIPNAHEAKAPTSTEVKTTEESENEKSETNNNVLPKMPSFTFGLPANKSEDEIGTSKKAEEKVESASKIAFTFGVPKSTPSPVPPNTTSIFGTDKLGDSVVKSTDEHTAQVVPKVDFGISKTQETPKPVPNLFASPLSSLQDKPPAAPLVSEKSATSSTLLDVVPMVRKDSSSNALPLQPVTSPETAPQQTPVPTFSLGSGGGLKLSANLFAPPASSTTVTNITFGTPKSVPSNPNSVFQKNESTGSVPAISSVFSKSDSTSLFQKNEIPISTSAPLPFGTTSPMFTFGGGNASGSTLNEQPKTFGGGNASGSALNEQPKTFGGGNASGSTPNEQPKFNFTAFGNKNEKSFKPDNKFSFGALTTNATGNAGSMSGNTLGGNSLSSGNSLGVNMLSGGNGLPANQLSSGNEMTNNLSSGTRLQTANTLQQPTGGIFGVTVQKDNVWPAANNNNNSSNNLFSPNVAPATSLSLQKPAAFTFGSSTPFNANNSTPAFGSATQSTPNIFGMTNQTTSQPSMFSSTSPNNVFGSPQGTNVFGTPSSGATSAFGVPNPPVPAFEAPSLNPSPAPAFNFGGQQQSTGIFGFGQQQQQQHQQQVGPQAGGVYSFGASPVTPQVQFSMGSAPNTTVRRVRKAVRRTTPR